MLQKLVQLDGDKCLGTDELLNKYFEIAEEETPEINGDSR